MCKAVNNIEVYEIFKAKYEYYPLTGKFTYRTGQKHLIGTEAGKVCNRGYTHLSAVIAGKLVRIQAHRLAWFFVTGEMPPTKNELGEVLVINHIETGREGRSNNRWSNLELVTNRKNSNQKHLRSSSGYVGVYWNKTCEKWRTQIRINGKRKHLGYFKTELEAHEAYQTALTHHKQSSFRN